MTKLNQEASIYTGIDVFKIISAIMVVLLHTVETTNYYAVEIKEVFTRFAVPFFFIASGFFFIKVLKNLHKNPSVFKNMLRIFCF